MYCTLFQNQALCSVIVMHEKNQWIPKFFHARLFEFQLINIIKKVFTFVFFEVLRFNHQKSHNNKYEVYLLYFALKIFGPKYEQFQRFFSHCVMYELSSIFIACVSS